MTTAPDGTQLAMHRWTPSETAGLVRRPAYLLHGLGEHAGRYDGLVRWLDERGWSVAAHDHRGHGRSSGKRGSLRHEEDLVLDAEHRLAEYARETGEPPLLIGHSLGALVAARIALRANVPLAGVVLSSPPFAIQLPGTQRLLLNMLGNMAPDLRVSTGLQASKLSHDQAVIDAYENDPLVHDRITARLARFIEQAGAASIAEAHTLTWRTLLLVSGADGIVDPAGSRRFADSAAPGKLALRWYPQGYHEIFNETPEFAEPVYADLQAWLDTLATGA
jgi:alpha-beta hydrolase superfamily lysophospholipase